MDHDASDYLTMPAELASLPPRRVQLNMDGDARYALLMVVLFLVGGLSILGWTGYYDAQQIEHRSSLRGNVRKVVGTVSGITWARFSPTYVDYTYNVEGVSYSGEALEPANPVDVSFETGSAILVRYLPSNPEISHPDAWEWSLASGWWAALFVTFLTAIGTSALAVLLRERQVARLGAVCPAIIKTCTQKGRLFYLEYEFRADDEIVVGTTSGKDEYAPGARVWILYLQRRPRKNRLYPLSLYSIV
jgi:hypothetical protein